MPIVKYNHTKYKGNWKSNTYYTTSDLVYHGGALWSSTSDFQSGGVFNESNWVNANCSYEDFSLDPLTATSSALETTVSVSQYKHADKPVKGLSSEESHVFSVNSHNDSGYYYAEFKQVSSTPIQNSLCGISWSNSITANSTDSLTISHSQGRIYSNGSQTGTVSPWNNLLVYDILRLWVRNGKIWVGARRGGIDTVVGDPAGNVGEVATFTPTNPIRVLIIQRGVCVVAYNAKSYNIQCDPLGATPFED